MFKGLRLRLTLLYLLVALALVTLVGGSAYLLVGSYFQTTTDLALKHKMVEEFQRLSAPIPSQLASADQAWFADRARQPALAAPAAERHGNEDDGEAENRETNEVSDEAYDAELATIFVLRLNRAGQALRERNVSLPPFAPDRAAFSTALARGDDLRTVILPDGRRVRVLSYRLDPASDQAVVQLGRLLTDQDRVLKRLLAGLLLLGGACAVGMGAGSWWLAGRSLQPARQAWQRQQSFVANASHELRAPLTLLRATAEVTLRSLASEDTDRRELLGDVIQECDHMSRLVGDLLLLSRLDAGGLQMAHEQIGLSELLADVARQIGRRAEQCGVRVVCDGASGAIWGDPTRIRQILLILLDNALRHTPPGGVVHLATRASGRYTQISVADTGSGIAPHDLPQVFERFYRADSVRKDNGGSGLGLSIAKALVEAHGGHITIESQPGQGTSVSVELPSAGVENHVPMRLPLQRARSQQVQEPEAVAVRRDPDASKPDL
jgi:signal transduction histidine kinase